MKGLTRSASCPLLNDCFVLYVWTMFTENRTRKLKWEKNEPWFYWFGYWKHFLTDFCFINVTFTSPQYRGLITQAQAFSLLADCASQVRKVILLSSVSKLDLKESRHILDAFKFQNLFVNIISTPLQVYAQNVHLLIWTNNWPTENVALFWECQ